VNRRKWRQKPFGLSSTTALTINFKSGANPGLRAFDNVRATEEGCPTQSGGIVLSVEERVIRTVLEQNCRSLSELRRNVQSIGSTRIGFTR
jgi:hypothetical protein